MVDHVYRTLVRRAWPPIIAGAVRALNRITTFVPPPPSAAGGGGKVLVVSVHPNGKQPSFTLALATAVCDSLEAEGELVIGAL